MSEANRQFDVAVLGGGPGGYSAALRAALRGARTCCVEQGLIGGTCLNVGCIPTKAMLHVSGLFHELGSAGAFGLRVGEAAVDGPAFMARAARVTETLRKGLSALLAKRGVEVIAARGRLAGPRRVEAQPENGTPSVIEAKAVILATGSSSARPAWLPWASGRVWTTEEACAAKDLPKSVLVLGGGVIGCEFATVYSELGIPTTVVEMLDRLLPMMEPDAGRAVARSLRKRKVQVHAGVRVAAVEAGAAGVAARLESGQVIEADILLAAVGRKPNTSGIGLEEAGVRVEKGLVPVDDRCRTNIEGVYAVGDIAETRQYAHLATRMGLVAADNATGHDSRDDRAVLPAGVYTHPEIATVGLGEDDARKACPSLQVGRYSYQACGLAQAHGAPEGLVKIMGDKDGGRILGAIVIGERATDVIQEIALAMRGGLSVEQVAHTIHSHPTFVEGVLEAAESWMGLPLHTLM
jgi:dihydrolipoamide dehydrogenase